MSKTFFQPGSWIGKGTLSISMIEGDLPIWIRFDISEHEAEGVPYYCRSEYQIIGHDEPIINLYAYTYVVKGRFGVVIENELWDKAFGRGFVDDNSICLEFPEGEHGFEGFESYQFLDDNTFSIEGEFVTDKEMRSKIKGKMVKHIPVGAH